MKHLRGWVMADKCDSGLIVLYAKKIGLCLGPRYGNPAYSWKDAERLFVHVYPVEIIERFESEEDI